jgi:hypothetical protein
MNDDAIKYWDNLTPDQAAFLVCYLMVLLPEENACIAPAGIQEVREAYQAIRSVMRKRRTQPETEEHEA